MADDFRTIGEPGPAGLTLAVAGRAENTYHYRIAGQFGTPDGIVIGPYSNRRCVTVDLPPVADTATPSFTAPAVTADTQLTFKLTVTEGGGLTATDSIVVTVKDVPVPPVPAPQAPTIGNNAVGGALPPLTVLLLGLLALRRRRVRG